MRGFIDKIKIDYPDFNIQQLQKLINSKQSPFNFNFTEFKGCPVFPSFYYFHSKLKFNDIESTGSGEAYDKEDKFSRKKGDIHPIP